MYNLSTLLVSPRFRANISDNNYQYVRIHGFFFQIYVLWADNPASNNSNLHNYNKLYNRIKTSYKTTSTYS